MPIEFSARVKSSTKKLLYLKNANNPKSITSDMYIRILRIITFPVASVANLPINIPRQKSDNVMNISTGRKRQLIKP